MWKLILSIICLALLIYSYSEGTQSGRAVGRTALGVLFLLLFGLYMFILNWKDKKNRKVEKAPVVVKKMSENKNQKLSAKNKGSHKKRKVLGLEKAAYGIQRRRSPHLHDSPPQDL